MTKYFSALLLSLAATAWAAPLPPVEVYPGVWRFTLGTPEALTPGTTRSVPVAQTPLAQLPPVANCPVSVEGSVEVRGCVVRIPLAPDELVYGLGLQLHSFQQRGLKKTLRVNADATLDTGDTNAPVPFYVTTRGYGVFVDTARYATFYCGNKHPLGENRDADVTAGVADGWNHPTPLRRKLGIDQKSEVLVDVPAARGVDVYVFGGPTLRLAVQRYNLFSGGGVVPPRWGLGFWYRCQSDFDQAGVLGMAAELRDRRIPCDVLGLEPHWQSHSYSCTYVWAKGFADPAAMLSQLGAEHYRLNLWEHAFVNPSSPIYSALRPLAGNYEVWGGLVPDFLSPGARRIFGDFHEKEHVAIGVSGYKLDECDNSDFTGNWSFPEISRFPSGADGEQMHSLFGLRYQDTLQEVFNRRHQRTYGLVRSSHALAAPYPYVLYSDLYDHRQFIRGVAEMGFSGLLWNPEVRDAQNPRELIRRLESAAFSPLAMINAWYLKNPPWKQVKRAANNTGDFAPGWEEVEAQCRSILELRMRFIPYLHAAFVRYQREGLPPFRALVMDFPGDSDAAGVDDEYLMGEDVLVAPVIVSGVSSQEPEKRSVYLPQGTWYNFWTGKSEAGGRKIEVTAPLGQIPLFVRAGTVLPLATPTLSTEDPRSRELTLKVFGDGSRPTTLFEDDGSWTPSLAATNLTWNATSQVGQVSPSPSASTNAYHVRAWESVP